MRRRTILESLIATAVAAASMAFIGAAQAADRPTEIRLDYATYNPLSLVLKERKILEDALGREPDHGAGRGQAAGGRMSRPPLDNLINALAARPRVLILLDYDGTLVPIRSRPSLARLDEQHRATLARLHGGRLRLAMVSGRSVRNLRERVGLEGIGYCGVFGLEVHFPGWTYLHRTAKRMRP